MSETRCDLCGPYTPEQAAALLLEQWKPEPTGHLCDQCRADVKVCAQEIADRIDDRAMSHAYGQQAPPREPGRYVIKRVVS